MSADLVGLKQAGRTREPGATGSIHSSAVVSPAAILGADVRIGPWCSVGPDVVLGDGVELISHAVVDGHTEIGAGAKLFPFCTVGMAPQDLKYRGEPTRCFVGANAVVTKPIPAYTVAVGAPARPARAW